MQNYFTLILNFYPNQLVMSQANSQTLGCNGHDLNAEWIGKRTRKRTGEVALVR